MKITQAFLILRLQKVTLRKNNIKAMSYKKIILIVGFVIVVIVYYFYLHEQKSEEKVLTSNKIGILSKSTLNTLPPDNYKKFISRNKKLIFLYREDWKCNEVVYDIRIDCYPLTRVEEEYDAGLDELIVYYPDISFGDDNGLCSLVVDDGDILKAKKEPLVYNERGDNYYGLFYKKFNDCLTKIITLPYIDKIEKLEEVIK